MHIDWWTLALQTVNVLILVWILARFFYRPVADIIEKRRAAAAKLMSDASDAQKAVDADKAAIAAARAGFAAERDVLLAKARKDADAAKDAVLQQAAAAAAALRTQGEAALAHDRKAMEQAMTGRAGTLAVDIAQKLLETLPPGFATAAVLSGLGAQLAALPQKNRALLAAAARGSGLAVVTAAALDAAQQAACRKTIEDFLGAPATLAFQADAALIAGLEIRGEAITLKANWRDDLARIQQNLANDDGQG